MEQKDISWNLKNTKLAKASALLKIGGDVPAQLELETESFLTPVFVSGMAIGGFVAFAGGMFFYVGPSAVALAPLLFGLVLFIGCLMGYKGSYLNYILDGTKKALTYRFGFFGYKRGGIVAHFSDICAVSVTARREKNMGKYWWAHQVVMVTNTGRVVAVTKSQKSFFTSLNQIAQNFAKLVDANFIPSNDESNAVAKLDENGKWTFAIVPYSGFNQYKGYIIFAVASMIALFIFVKAILPILFG